jgi:hypothetical protein
MEQALDHREFYRLPWNYADNGISWLEPTTKCNLRCEGCYRDLENPVHKTLDEVRADLEVFRRLRKSDCMSIAGGDPLVYPDIVPLVKMVKEMGWKPIVNTNGVALTEPLLRELKEAGVFGFTFHIDTSQNRPKAKGWSETELNAERLRYAEMLAKVGGLACSFNATVNERTLPEVPNLVEWARKHADIVQTMVFILFRSPDLTGEFDYYAQGRKLNFGSTYKETDWGGERSVFAPEIAGKIREGDPLYKPAAFLNGTANPESLKWLLANRIVLGGEVMGYVSPRFMELVQNLTHLFTGSYLAYAGPESTARGKLAAFAAGLVDRSPPAELHDHPAGQLRGRRPPGHVRRLPRHDRARRQAGLELPPGGAEPVRLLRRRRSEAGRGIGAGPHTPARTHNTGTWPTRAPSAP